MAVPDLSMPGADMYQRLLAQAAGTGDTLLLQVLAATRLSMREQAQCVRGMLERDHLDLSIKLLDTHASRMCERFPVILTDVFRSQGGAEAKLGGLSGQALRLDQLELMDEGQVQERIEMARVLQHVMLKVEASLAELNTYICALIGLHYVSPGRNALRPEAYVSALQQLMTELRLPTLVRTAWLHHMASGLGEALSAAYLEWSAQLQGQRVQGVGYTVVRTPEPATNADKGQQRRKDRAIWTPQYRQTVLTLDRLRRLMVGNLEVTPDGQQEAFARKFAREFETDDAQVHAGVQPDTGFELTMPAALDALQEMQQVEAVVQRMQQRPPPAAGRSDADSTGALVREELTQTANAMSQVLSLEVVSLMVDNLIKDARLLPQVRKIIERLEPALLRLVMIDPRFFIDRQHPARCLLQEIAQRGLAFGSADDPDFNTFMLTLQRQVSPLAVMQIDSAQPFEAALNHLLKDWDDAGARATIAGQIDSAAAVLGYAEQRYLRAEQMALRLKAIPDMGKVPNAMVDFLTGPWSQVMAEAELKDKAGSDDAGGYKTLVNELLWSAQPVLTRKDIARLTKLVPRLLSKLREGLGLIGYPSVKTSAFFDVLMKLHQQAFRPAAADVVPVVPEAPAGLAPSLLGSQDQWVAPAEAKVSGFMAFADDSLPKKPAALAHAAMPTSTEPAFGQITDLPELPVMVAALAVGSWLELEIKGHWQRTQLSWISPHGTMYLFTSGQGKSQSMSQRMLERLLAAGKLRMVSAQASMVDGALDAVVHTAMLNSIDFNT
jgi:hypothetical protein